ncbi:MAG: FkbM family methyltransferase [Desulfuromonadaceae bacterium]
MTIRRLHIGALHSTPGWESLNSQPLADIDHVCDAGDLTRFADGTFAELYASHVFEHFDYRDEFAAVLAEWFRVLAPGGRLFVSVPDMDTICRMYCDRVRFDSNDRYMLMRMILGGHSDQYDYHHAAYNEELLVHYLSVAGFSKITRQEEFGLFDDTSAMRFYGELISLNLTAEKILPATRVEHIPANSHATDTVNPGTEGSIRHVSFSITRDGRTYPCEYLFDTSQLTQRNLAAHLLNGTLYEPEVSLVLMQILQEGDGFVDVGANAGFFTVIAARLVGASGLVHAFEPEASNFQRLKQNITLNGLTNVELHEAAVGDQNAETELYINSDNDGGHALWNPGAHSFNQRSRETVILQKTSLVTLDAVLGSLPEAGPKVKAIKIDAEGYEQHVLLGALETILSHRIPFILAEINRFALNQAGADEQSFRRILHHLGYVAYLAEIDERDSSIHFMEMPLHFIPCPDNPETVYNIVFCLSGELERHGLMS